MEKELKKCSRSAKMIAKSTITEKRQKKWLGRSTKKERKKC